MSTGQEQLAFKVPQGSGAIQVSLRGEVAVNMRSGTPDLPRVQVGVSSRGFTEAGAIAQTEKARAD